VAELGEASRSLEKLSEALGKFDVDLAAIRRNLCSDRPCCVAKPDLRDLRIFSAVFRRGEASSETLSLMVLELFLFLSARAASPCPSSQYFRKSQIEAAKKMHQRLTEDLSKRYTLEELSLMHGFPLTSMKSCFKEIYGEPIGIYMRKRRMSAAAAMLADSDATVAEIAESVGYESHAKFSAAFKSCAGLAPSEFRKAAQKG
jgi:AraC-like DNA-binding protein